MNVPLMTKSLQYICNKYENLENMHGCLAIILSRIFESV